MKFNSRQVREKVEQETATLRQQLTDVCAEWHKSDRLLTWSVVINLLFVWAGLTVGGVGRIRGWW